MANEIGLKITTNELEVLKSLDMIENAALDISKTKYKLDFDVSGIDKKAVSAINAVAKLRKAQAEYNESLQAEKKYQVQATAAETARIKAQSALAVEQQKTAKAAEQTAKASKQVEAAQERRKTSEINLQREEAKRAAKAAEVAAKEKEAADATDEGAAAAERAAKAFSALGGVLTPISNFLKRELKKAFSEALDTMREVDQELANIAKVSNYSAEEIKKIGEDSYEVASRYGITADQYLASTAEWAKAGYENATQLAELSTKLQLVGDASSEVASKMLLSADAAWGFGGSVEDLNHVIDAANIIENNYATSIEKLAEGFPIVASTAAMVGMTVDETMAAIGTISAATQESGRKSATALRSLILNLMKEVGTFEDGVEVTEESVSKLYFMLERYEPEALAAAEATGKIVDPMTAVSALAQAASEGLMTEAEMANYLSEIGGKLRTNQLSALVSNQEMYNEMLALTGEAAGSAEKEIAVLLDTWNAKTNILQNSWTKFVSDLIDTEWVKKAIDGATSVIETFDTLARLLDGGGKKLGSADGGLYYWFDSGEESFLQAQEAFREWKSLTKEQRKEQGFDEYLEQWKIAHDIIEDTTEVLQEDTEATEENTEAKEDSTEAQKETADAVEEVTDALKGAKDAKNDFDAAMKAGERDDLFKGYVDAYKTLQEEIEAGRLNSNAFWASSEFLFGEEVLDQMGRDAEKIAEHAGEVSPLFDDAADAGKGLLEVMQEAADETGRIRDEGGNVIATISGNAEEGWSWLIEDADALAEKLGINVDAVVAMQEALNVWSEVGVTGSKKVEDAEGDVAEAANDAQGALEDAAGVDFSGEAASIDGVTDALEGATSAAWDYVAAAAAASHSTVTPGYGIGDIGGGTMPAGYGGNGSGGSSSTATQWNTPTLPTNAAGTRNFPGGESLVNEVGPELISDRGRAFIANGGAPAVVNLSKGAVVFNAEETRRILGTGRAYNGMPSYRIGRNADFANFSSDTTRNYTPGGSSGSRGSGGSGGSGSGNASVTSLADMKSVQDLLDALLKNLDLQAKLAKNEGNVPEMNRLYQQAQDEIQKVIDQYLAAGYEATSNEVLTLRNLIYDYAGKMQDMTADAWKTVESGLSDVLKSMDQQAKLAETEGRIVDANKLYEQAQDEIEKVIDQYLAAGYAEDSDEIVKLRNTFYQYADKMHDLTAEAWEALESALDETLGSIDAQATLAANQGDGAKVNQLYQQAQDEIQKVLDQYLEAGYDEMSDEVVRLRNLMYDYADKMLDVAAEAMRGLEDALSDTLSNLDAQATLANNRGDIGGANRLYQQATDEIQKVLNEYLAAGYSETSDEVLRLRNLMYDYADKMLDVAAEAMRGLEDALSDTLSNLDAQATLANNRGDLAGANGLYQQAQDEIEKVIDQYLAAGYNETSDEVLRLQNMMYSYADKMRDLAAEGWRELEDALDKALNTIDAQIILAQNQGDSNKILNLYQQAQEQIGDLINQYLDAGYAPDSDEVVALANRGYGYAGKQQSAINSLWQALAEAIQGLKDATEDANDIAEKQLAVDEATLAYANAQKQRTVRIFNPASGQWEWVADEAAIQNAQANLQKAQESLSDAEFSRMLERVRGGEASLEEILASSPISAQFDGASGGAQAAFLSALGGYYGAVDRTGSTAAGGMFSTSDSHNTNYNFGGITLSREQAEGMTLAQLANYLSYSGIAS